MLHDDDGSFARVPVWLTNYALAGSVLMDLALENRIDTDLEKLVVVDPTPTGESLLDRTLADITAGTSATPASGWSARRIMPRKSAKKLCPA